MPVMMRGLVYAHYVRKESNEDPRKSNFTIFMSFFPLSTLP